MAQFVFPPVSVTIDYQAADAAGALPSQLAIVGGWSGTAIKAVKVDSTGSLVIGSSGLPTGAATEAKQDTMITDLTNIETYTNTIQGAVASGQMQVDVVASLPTGSNQIGKLAANSGVDIGDVDVLSSALPTGAATSALQTSSEAILTTIDADTSILAGAVASGQMQVDIVADGAGLATSAKQDVIETTLTAIETDVDTSAGAVKNIQSAQGTTDAGIPALVVRNDTLADLSGADGDYSPLQVNATGALYTSLATAIPAGTATIGKVDVNALAPVDFLDAGVLDSSTTNIPSTGVNVVVSGTGLAAACTEIEVVDDIGEYMSLRVGGAVKTYLPLGGGRVKVSLASTNVVQLYSETGTTISSGKIAINFLG